MDYIGRVTGRVSGIEQSTQQAPEMSSSMIDVQGSGIHTGAFALHGVGLSGLTYPVAFRDDGSGGEVQHAPADWTLAVALPADHRGAHMSRFVETLHARARSTYHLADFGALALELREVLAAGDVSVGARFTWFREVRAPKSARASLLAHQVECRARTISGDGQANPTVELASRIVVPVKSLCPCSKAISDRGAHNQRSTVDVRLTAKPMTLSRSPAQAASAAPDAAAIPSFARLAALLDSVGSAPIYPLLKREDEKFITESAYDNPVFVEDACRRAGELLADLTSRCSVHIRVTNQESIHAHDCFAELHLPLGSATGGAR